MRIISVTLFGVLALSACTVPEPQSEIVAGKPYQLTARELAVVKSSVRQAMKDPQSAMFGRIAASISSDKVVTVCGFVNGKNSFGGYVGKKPFLGVLTGQNTGYYVIDIGSSDIEVNADLRTCQKAGISF